MNKNPSYVPIFIVAKLLQYLFLISILLLLDASFGVLFTLALLFCILTSVNITLLFVMLDVSFGLGLLFTLLIPVDLILSILILVDYIKNKELYTKININMNMNNLPLRDTLKSYVIEFPFYGVRDDGEGEDEKYFGGKETYKWFDDSIIDAINFSWNGNNIPHFITEKELKKKLKDMQLFVCKDGTCKIIVNIFEELTTEEKEYLLDFVKGQASEGLGKGKFDFEDSNGKQFSVKFWKDDSSWYIKYRDENLSSLMVEKIKQLTAKECYEIELSEEKANIKDNKMGGIPYLPIGEEYPKDKNGDPMPLILQVNLKDIKLDSFPNEGILEIFVSPPMNGIDEFDYCVKYYKDDLEYRTDNFPIIDLEKCEYFIQSNYRINLKKVKCHMPHNDFRFEKVVKNVADDIMHNVLDINKNSNYDINKIFGNITYNYYNETGVYIPSICIGGYSDFCQWDQRGVYTSEDKTECLFKLSNENVILFSLISPADLKKKEFDKTYINFDCD